MSYDFKDLKDSVRAYIGRSPNALIEYADEDSITSFINRRRDEWAELTRCFYEEKGTFTLAANTPTYDMESASFSRPFFLIEQLTIEAAPLRTLTGNVGEVSQRQLFDQSPTHQTANAQKPAYWSFSPPRSIRFWPTPDAAYDDCYVSGYYYPTPLVGDGDNTLLSRGEFDIFSRWCAAGALNPIRDDDDAKRFQWLRAEGDAYIKNKQMKMEALAISKMYSRGNRTRVSV